MKTYGILGGTFDPIHNGHISLAVYIQQKMSFHKVILIPALSPPHKSRTDIASPEDRFEMIKLAAENYPDLEISDIELRRKGTSYTINTLRELYDKNPNTKFRLIIGTDMLNELHLWKDIKSIIELGNPIIALRPGAEYNKTNLISTIDKSIHRFADMLAENILEVPPVPVSSTELRKKLKNNEAPGKTPLPSGVADYIKKNSSIIPNAGLPATQFRVIDIVFALSNFL